MQPCALSVDIKFDFLLRKSSVRAGKMSWLPDASLGRRFPNWVICHAVTLWLSMAPVGFPRRRAGAAGSGATGEPMRQAAEHDEGDPIAG